MAIAYYVEAGDSSTVWFFFGVYKFTTIVNKKNRAMERKFLS
jgi:hypothetical protein